MSARSDGDRQSQQVQVHNNSHKNTCSGCAPMSPHLRDSLPRRHRSHPRCTRFGPPINLSVRGTRRVSQHSAPHSTNCQAIGQRRYCSSCWNRSRAATAPRGGSDCRAPPMSRGNCARQGTPGRDGNLTSISCLSRKNVRVGASSCFACTRRGATRRA